MNLSLLAAAAEYVERSARVPINGVSEREQVAAESEYEFRGASSWPAGFALSGDVNGQMRRQQATSLSSTRTAHNVMEKNRRAYLRYCMEGLRNELPIPDGQRCTTLSILAKARRYVDYLERDTVRLQQERIALQNLNKSLRSRLRSYSVADPRSTSPGSSDYALSVEAGDIPQATAAFARIQLMSNGASPRFAAPSPKPVANGVVKLSNGAVAVTQSRPTVIQRRRRCVTLNSDFTDYVPQRNAKVHGVAPANAYRLRPKTRHISTPSAGGRFTPPATGPSLPASSSADAASRRLVSVLKPMPPPKLMSATGVPYRAHSMSAVTPTSVARSTDADGESESAVFFADGDADVDMADVSASTSGLQYAFTSDSSPDAAEAVCGVIEIEVSSGVEPLAAVAAIENEDNSSNDSGVITNS